MIFTQYYETNGGGDLATIKDVALKARISPSTVSRVLNGDQTFSVTDETRLRILKAAEQLNYQVRRRKESKNRSQFSLKNIGVVQFWGPQEQYWDQFFVSIRVGVEREFSKLGLDFGRGLKTFYDNELSCAEIQELDGVLVIGENNCFNESVYVGTENVVFLDLEIASDKYDCVIVDFAKATIEALNYLFELGHRQIGYIGGDTSVQKKNDRWIAFKQFMEGRGLFRPEFTAVGGWTTNEGYQMMKKIIESRKLPTAFFIASDSLAIGAIRALHESGMVVPDDVSIVGFNDLEMARFLNPPLTTVKVHTEIIGRLGVRLLVDRLGGRDVPLKVTVPTELMVRESCRRLND